MSEKAASTTGGFSIPGVGILLRENVRKVVDPLVLTLGILAIWEVGIAFYDVNPLVFPAPSGIFETLTGNTSIFVSEATTTLLYIVVAFVTGTLTGVVSAFVIHYSTIVYRIVFPILMIAFVIPKIALAPLLLLYLGTGRAYFVILPLMFVFFPVLENTLTGLRGVDEDLMDLSKLYGPSGWFVFRHVQVPYSLPYIGAGVKIGVTQSTIGVIIAEIIAPQWGLGSLLMIGQTYSRTTVIFGSIFLIGLIGITVFKIVEVVEGRVIFWRDVEGAA